MVQPKASRMITAGKGARQGAEGAELTRARTAATNRSDGAARLPAKRRAAPRLSLEEQAYIRLKQDILTCALKPGALLNVVQLSERLGIGRTPVHAAIARLQFDRLLQVIPRKGIFVRPVTIDEYLDLIDARLVNEAEAARLAALHRTPEDLIEMERLIEEMEKAHSTDDLRTIFLDDRELHLLIARCSRNAVLEEIIGPMFDRTLRIWFLLHGATRRSIRPMQDEHRELLAAIRDRDAERAAAVMREHILVARSNVISHGRAVPA
jgi:DNA-binding GntR family transcriptional regulator